MHYLIQYNNQPLVNLLNSNGHHKKQRVINSPYDLTEYEMYQLLLPYTLSSRQLAELDYPLMHDYHYGIVYISSHRKQKQKAQSDKNSCIRCHQYFEVDKKGIPINKHPCTYHPGRVWTKKVGQSFDSFFSCCKQPSNDLGCCSATHHVKDISLDPNATIGYVSTKSVPTFASKSYKIYALDCEMSYTTIGLEVTKVTLVDRNLQVIFETFVKPPNPIVDYNTKYSGITRNDLQGVTTTLQEVRVALCSFLNPLTILIGHSLESDLKALKIVHEHVIDTAVLFPHHRGLPFKRSLKNLMYEFLNTTIQAGGNLISGTFTPKQSFNIPSLIQSTENGHDSREDASSCMKLVFWKLSQNMPITV